MIWVIFRTAVNWWLVNVNTDGTVNNNNANYSNGFAPGFCMDIGQTD